MRPLKIALLSRWYWEENRRSGTAEGGTVQQLAEAVAALGHEIVILSQSPKIGALEKNQIGTLEAWLSPREKKRDFLTGLRDKWAKRTYGHRKVHSDALDLRDFLARRGPFDVLWAQCEEPDGLVAAIASGLGVSLPPLLVQIQALRYRFEKGVPVFNGKPALRAAFRQAARIIANSELVAGRLPVYGDRELTEAQFRAKTHIVYPNLHRSFIRAAAEMADTTLLEPGRVLFFGALNEGKGALVFLDALLRTEAAKTGATFVITGNFTEKNPRFVRSWNEKLGAVRARLAPAQLELPGKIPLDEVVRQVRRANIAVLPSLFDAFSRALVEALVLGRPVITTDQVGACPLVKDHGCGLVVAPHDADALARAIDDALRPGTGYLANAQRVAPRLLHEFSPEAIALQISRHLCEIAAPCSGGP
jgi:glycosyltransferase involved in cell wall biosynthesis